MSHAASHASPVPAPHRRLALPAALLLLAAACGGGGAGEGGRTGYANDADSGAAAPATQQTLSPNPEMGKANPGVERGTGVGNMAGDTTGAYGKAAGAHGAVPGQPTPGPAGSGSRSAGGAPRP